MSRSQVEESNNYNTYNNIRGKTPFLTPSTEKFHIAAVPNQTKTNNFNSSHRNKIYLHTIRELIN